ncbi:MAG: hypothetical protein NZM37_10895 [Sandaracinaceae bacterium]|nr:hypothetical protein [Sandaracinaceae bacterium]
MVLSGGSAGGMGSGLVIVGVRENYAMTVPTHRTRQPSAFSPKHV